MSGIGGYTFKPIVLGDMAIVTDRKITDGKLIKALAMLNIIHKEFDKTGVMAFPGKSKESCILCALTVRDFLQRIGFKDASVRSVGVLIRARRNGAELHSVGVGLPLRFYEPDALGMYNSSGWNGHLVTTVDRFLIDTTLTPWKREHWPHLPSMLTLPYEEPNPHKSFPMKGLFPIAATWTDIPDDKTYEGEVIYLDQPKNRSWKAAPDAGKGRRRAVVDALTKQFGSWRG
jgi:hypothetical protein